MDHRDEVIDIMIIFVTILFMMLSLAAMMEIAKNQEKIDNLEKYRLNHLLCFAANNYQEYRMCVLQHNEDYIRSLAEEE